MTSHSFTFSFPFHGTLCLCAAQFLICLIFFFRMERASSTASVTESTANDVFVDCFADEGGDNGGLSNKTVVVLLIGQFWA